MNEALDITASFVCLILAICGAVVPSLLVMAWRAGYAKGAASLDPRPERPSRDQLAFDLSPRHDMPGPRLVDLLGRPRLPRPRLIALVGGGALAVTSGAALGATLAQHLIP